MQEFQKVGFSGDDSKTKEEEEQDMVASIPKQILQFYTEIPTQYRLIYLLAFLYAHQKEKVIVFVSNCELVNFLSSLLSKFDWNKCGRRLEEVAD